MDDRRFDALTRSLAGHRSRRGVLKGLLGAAGGAAALLLGRSAEAAWSTQVCLPVDDQGHYTLRLVPTAAVPLYVQRYGAVLPENGACPSPSPVCPEACPGCMRCLDRLGGGVICGGSGIGFSCASTCTSDDDCTAYTSCVTAYYVNGERRDACSPPPGEGFCASTEACSA